MGVADRTATKMSRCQPSDRLSDEERELIRIVRGIRKVGGKITVTMRGDDKIARISVQRVLFPK